MISFSVPMGIFAAVTAGTTPIDMPDTTMPLVLVAETTQSDNSTATRNTVDLLGDIVANASLNPDGPTRVPAPAKAVKLIDPRALIRPQLRPGSDHPPVQLAAMQMDMSTGRDLTQAQPAASDTLAAETAAARAAITGQPIDVSPTSEHADETAAEHAAHGEHAEHAAAGTGNHDHMMMMPAPDPNRSSCVNEIATVADRTTIYFNSSSSELDKRSREAAFLIASLAQKCPEARIKIEGFTDPIGDPAVNLALSWKRANTVLRTIKSGGFSDKAFTVMSHMQDHKDEICPHWDVVDRRVEFVITQAN